MEDVGRLFQDPSDYYKPEKPATEARHELLSGETITVRLVGQHPLWAHMLWNAGRTVAHYLEEHNEQLVRDRTVLELGAGAGLPSLVCALRGAKQVVVSDYPDHDLIANLQYNISNCHLLPNDRNITAEGFLWGSPPDRLLSHLSSEDPNHAGFDLLILADLLFNHSEHGKLAATVQSTLKRSPSSCALVFFTPYRPWLLQKDLAFFGIITEMGFMVRKVLEKVLHKAMFDDDPGDEQLRRTVYGYELTWQS